MTRINCIPVKELTDRHLLAEYRELPRIFNLAKIKVDAPASYVLGTGHMKFFYDKLEYLVKRQIEIVKELNKRGVRTTFKAQGLRNHHEKNGGKCPALLWNDWKPTKKAMMINRQRINERLKNSKNKTGKASRA